jgi:hypothetical protein
MYAIQCISGSNKGKFVAVVGNKTSYTDRRSANVRKFKTYEDAKRECCIENECVIELNIEYI